jgi:His-Xaa-Ser system radical SAM maturase HxsB
MCEEKFFSPEHFMPEVSGYVVLPFRFMEFDGRKFLSNDAGEYCFLEDTEFHEFVSGTLDPQKHAFAYRQLKSKQMLTDTGLDLPVRMLATKYRTKRGFLDGFTRLHIFVVTLRCEHTCQYCQVSRVTADKTRYDMSRETADRALDHVFRVPGREVKIEFQGGEPLLNFELIRYVVEEAERRNRDIGKEIQFVITSNLALITDEMLAFVSEHPIYISTSLDGPAVIHNANRPRPGRDSYELAVRGIERVRGVLGHDSVAALMTTTKLSLEHPEAIVNEYVELGFDYIFLRPISPYGFARRTRQRTGYETEAFLQFYQRALRYIIELNRKGIAISEAYAQILLTKILTPFPTGYVDLQSPSGAVLGAVVYNYDGYVYASDESRMLAEMGDTSFQLGNLHSDSYEQLFGGEVARSLATASCVESLPGCADCAFQTYCGADPIENYTTQGDVLGHRPTSAFCSRNMAIIKHLLRLYHGDDPFVRDLFWSWVKNAPAEALFPAMPN